jgi:hypothetical protein
MGRRANRHRRVPAQGGTVSTTWCPSGEPHKVREAGRVEPFFTLGRRPPCLPSEDAGGTRRPPAPAIRSGGGRHVRSEGFGDLTGAQVVVQFDNLFTIWPREKLIGFVDRLSAPSFLHGGAWHALGNFRINIIRIFMCSWLNFVLSSFTGNPVADHREDNHTYRELGVAPRHQISTTRVIRWALPSPLTPSIRHLLELGSNLRRHRGRDRTTKAGHWQAVARSCPEFLSVENARCTIIMGAGRQIRPRCAHNVPRGQRVDHTLRDGTPRT